MKEMTLSYFGSVKKLLRRTNFKNNTEIPPHILGFNCNFILTKERLDQYDDDLETASDQDFEWKKWEALTDLEKRSFQQNIIVLKKQKKWVVADQQQKGRPPTQHETQQRSFSPPSQQRVEGYRFEGSQKASASVSTDMSSSYSNDSDLYSRKKRKEPPTAELDPDAVKPRWTTQDDDKLETGVSKYGSTSTAFRDIAKNVFKGARSEQGCYIRWRRKHEQTKSSGLEWTKAEDTLLLKAVEKGKGESISWAAIASTEFDGSRSKDACKRRWSTIKGGGELTSTRRQFWTAEEVAVVREHLDVTYSKDDDHTTKLLKLLPGRSRMAILHKAAKLRLGDRSEERELDKKKPALGTAISGVATFAAEYNACHDSDSDDVEWNGQMYI